MKVYKRGSEPKGCLYVGRGSNWGNPYRIGYDGTRAEVIQKFRLYAIQRLAKEKEQQRAEKLAQKLRELGINPDEIA